MIKFKGNPVSYKFRITSPYDYRIHPITKIKHHHSGNDIAPSMTGVDGDNILSVADGKVVISKINSGGLSSGYGNYVLIQHDGWCTLYGHLSKRIVRVGQIVKAGQIIGTMGNTGSSTATHLHFQLYNRNYTPLFFSEDERGIDMNSVNPESYYVSPDKSWEDILKGCLDNPDGWIKAIDTLKEMAEMSSNIGDLELMKYFDELIIKIYKYGRSS